MIIDIHVTIILYHIIHVLHFYCVYIDTNHTLYMYMYIHVHILHAFNCFWTYIASSHTMSEDSPSSSSSLLTERAMETIRLLRREVERCQIDLQTDEELFAEKTEELGQLQMAYNLLLKEKETLEVMWLTAQENEGLLESEVFQLREHLAAMARQLAEKEGGKSEVREREEGSDGLGLQAQRKEEEESEDDSLKDIKLSKTSRLVYEQNYQVLYVHHAMYMYMYEQYTAVNLTELVIAYIYIHEFIFRCITTCFKMYNVLYMYCTCNMTGSLLTYSVYKSIQCHVDLYGCNVYFNFGLFWWNSCLFTVSLPFVFSNWSYITTV